MTPTPDAVDGTRARAGRSRPVKRTLAATVTAAMAITGLSVLGAQSADAATTPRAQSVGNFLDGTIGNNPIQDVLELADAHAKAPGTTSAQNPLDATVLRKLNLPLTGALQLPQLIKVIHLGAANQVAVAHKDGYSYGAAGAVNDQGGASVGGSSGLPSNAVVNLGPDALKGLSGNLGLGNILDSLGSVKLTVGAVSALAQTKSGGDVVTPSYHIAGLKLEIGSPALGTLLSTVAGALKVPSLPTLPGLPASCSLTTQVLSPLSLDDGAVTINPSNGMITVNVQALLHELGLNLNNLPANTDLIDYVLNYLTSPTGLAKGLQNVLLGIINPLRDKLTTCLADVSKTFPPPLDSVVETVLGLLNTLQTTLTNTANSVTDALGGAAGTDSPLAPLAKVLKNVVDIGVNVQSGPGAQTSNGKFLFHSQLAATPNQSTPVVKNQTLVRAIEINLVGDPLATLALANAAAGPSTLAPPTSPTTSPNNGGSSTPNGGPSGSTSSNTNGNGQPAGPNGGGNGQVPNGVPAGMATTGGAPALPLLLLAIGLVLAGGGVAAWKFRGVRAH